MYYNEVKGDAGTSLLCFSEFYKKGKTIVLFTNDIIEARKL